MIILSEGPYHIAVLKEPNICVVRGPKVKGETLLDRLRKDNKGSQIFPVHRLDKATSGIVLFAKSSYAQMALENAFKKRLVKKTYLALVEGPVNFTKLSIEKRLKPVGEKQTMDETGAFAHSIVRFKEKLTTGDYCLLEVNPVTGRMHQIRAHLSHIGHPIIGDELYGSKIKLRKDSIALFACGLSFPSPKGGRIDINAREFFDIKSMLKIIS